MGISDDLINFWEKIMKSKMADGEHLKPMGGFLSYCTHTSLKG